MFERQKLLRIYRHGTLAHIRALELIRTADEWPTNTEMKQKLLREARQTIEATSEPFSVYAGGGKLLAATTKTLWEQIKRNLAEPANEHRAMIESLDEFLFLIEKFHHKTSLQKQYKAFRRIFGADDSIHLFALDECAHKARHIVYDNIDMMKDR